MKVWFRKGALYWFILYNYIAMHGAKNIKIVLMEYVKAFVGSQIHWLVTRFYLVMRREF